MRMKSRVNIISVNYNSASDLLHCMKSVRDSDYADYQYWIVDNASPDGSLSQLEEGISKQGMRLKTLDLEGLGEASDLDAPDVVLIKNPVNAGFGAGNNVALRYLFAHRSDEYIWILNPDMEMEPNVLTDLVTVSQEHPNDLVGNLIHFFDRRDEVMYYGGFRVRPFVHGIVPIQSKQDAARLDTLAGASLFAPVAVFKNIGLFNESYFMYWEETEYGRRAENKGHQLRVNDRSKLYDRVGASSKTNFTREYLYLLNGLRFYKTYLPSHLPVILASTIAKWVKSWGEDATKRKAIAAGHIDFFKLLFGRTIHPLQRIQNQ